MSVIYKKIPDFPAYEAGSDGSIWTCIYQYKLPDNKGTYSVVGSRRKQLKGSIRGKSGHLIVTMCRDGKRHTRAVHRLILETFVGLRPPGMQCRHFPDPDPNNNRLENIQWGTFAENTADKIIHGNTCSGSKNSQAKLNEEKAASIRAEFAAGGITMKALAKKHNVSGKVIHNVVHRKSWKHV